MPGNEWLATYLIFVAPSLGATSFGSSAAPYSAGFAEFYRHFRGAFDCLVGAQSKWIGPVAG
jgi:hypothetical protein